MSLVCFGVCKTSRLSRVMFICIGMVEQLFLLKIRALESTQVQFFVFKLLSRTLNTSYLMRLLHAVDGDNSRSYSINVQSLEWNFMSCCRVSVVRKNCKIGTGGRWLVLISSFCCVKRISL